MMREPRMSVEQYDSPLRFLVSSETEPEGKHLVDLGENGIVGKCACQHFSFRMQPAIDTVFSVVVGGRLTEQTAAKLRCKHLVAAREYFTNRVVKVFLEGQAALKNPPCTTT